MDAVLELERRKRLKGSPIPGRLLPRYLPREPALFPAYDALDGESTTSAASELPGYQLIHVVKYVTIWLLMNLDDQMGTVFFALAHSVRRRILDVVKRRPGCCVNDVCEHFELSRIGVMKHLRVLQEAGLIVSEKQGRVRALYFNVVPIQLIHERWTTEYSAYWAHQMTRTKYALELEDELNVNE